MKDVRVLPEKARIAQAAVEIILKHADIAVQRRNRFNLMLSGGSTPLAVYSLLASRSVSAQISWDRWHLFWGDERCVPPDHPDSNFGTVREILLESVPIPLQNIHRILGELPPTESATRYQSELKEHFSHGEYIGGFPSFDLILLGMGTDGHTASLFPDSPVLGEKLNWVSPVKHTSPPLPIVDRVTVTLPLINAAEQVLFLIAGRVKSERLNQVLSLQGVQNEALPASMVVPVKGKLTWLVDRAAAGDWETV